MVRLLVIPEFVGQRLDVAVAGLARVARRRARAWIDAGAVWLNAKPCRVAGRPVELADVIDLLETGEITGVFAHPPPTILHADPWILAVDKPAGAVTQPPRVRRPGELTVQEMVALHLADQEGHRVEVMLVHRLDRLTTGVLVFARRHDAARALAAAWASGKVEKRYLAVVDGDPGEALRDLGGEIVRDALVRGRFRALRREGRSTRTSVRRLALLGERSLVEAIPHTGRTHQVRVHLSTAGFPVSGDTMYGGRRGVPRPLLHAWRLTLPHPRDGHRLRLEAPVPPDFVAFLALDGVIATQLAAPSS